ncbi:ArnT family glycosyltransferase [Lysobacter sp. A286]
MKQAARRLPFLLIATLIATIFLLKFVAYAWLVTPLWDIPDESGHYSYVEDIARGEWGVIGEARMGVEVTHSWKAPSAKPGMNWIAQHPPMFYVLDAPVVMAAQAAGLDFEQQVRSARMLGAVFGALTILGLALFLARATGREELGLAGAIFFAATPMFTHLSTGVSHDTMVACTAAWAAYWLTRWQESNNFRHLLYLAALVAICTVTKLTALAMAIPLFFALAWQLWRSAMPPSGPQRLSRIIVLWLVMFVPMCLWIARNLMTLGQIFPDASVIYDNYVIVPIGFFHLMREFPFWQHTLLNLIALIGWNGSGNGALIWVHANGWMARYFLAFFGIAALGAVVHPILPRTPERFRPAIVALGIAAIACVGLWWPLTQLAVLVCLLLLAALVGTLLMHIKPFIRGDNSQGWLLATAAACTLFFAFAYYEHLWAGFTGVMRATHGRYLYPVIPFLLLTLLWPFRGRIAARGLLCGAVVAMVFADGFYLHQVFNLYGQI